MTEEEGMALEKAEEFTDDVLAFKAARLQAADLLRIRCKEPPDADNLLSRIEAGFHACAHYGQGDGPMIEQAKGVAWKAFLDYSAQDKSHRATRPK